MKQILQNLNTGETELIDVPCPQIRPGHLLIQTRTSLISAGTERMLIEFGKAGYLDKMRQQPERVRMVLDKIATDGLLATIDTVRHKLEQSVPMGYSNVGQVVAVGAGVTEFKVGERVVSNGPHAEVVSVPRLLCARIPASVPDEAAAFTVVGAIALQGIRLTQPTLGESFAVIGLGLIGLLAAQLLQAHGCRVLGIDVDPRKLAMARSFGVETVDLSGGQDPLAMAQTFSRGHGMDGVLIAASTRSNDPIHQAARMCRKRGRIVLIGVVGMRLSRADFYEKELSFQVSCSYGPGRYDPSYELDGHDYPIGHARWTEQRNFEATLDTLAAGRLAIETMITHRYSIEQAPLAYATLSEDKSALGILLQYPSGTSDSTFRTTARLSQERSAEPAPPSEPVIGLIGAGDYATRTLIPAFKSTRSRLCVVATQNGVSGFMAGRRFGFQEATTDTERLINDTQINTVVIATRHDSHARYVVDALNAGKHVFVEKPLAIRRESLQEIQELYETLPAPGPTLMVGFNRRFAPHIVKMKALLDRLHAPRTILLTINAGILPGNHWLQNPDIGGGRIIGEGCHFVDLMRFLAGEPIQEIHATRMFHPGVTDDGAMTASFRFADGSTGTLHYLGNGPKRFPKERVEVFCAGRALQLDNFRRLRGYGWPGFKSLNFWRQDKGHRACISAFVEAIRQGAPSPIAFNEIVETTRATFDLADMLRT